MIEQSKELKEHNGTLSLGKPQYFDKLSEREKSLMYSRCYDDNLKLKKNIKEMTVLLK